jgi:uridylate kinase
MRLVVRIGGSVVASPLKPRLMDEYAQVLKTLRKQKHQVGVVVGGGEYAREFIEAVKRMGLGEKVQDETAILVSRVLAHVLTRKLGTLSCGRVPETILEAVECLKDGKMAVMGGLRPGITTDAVAALLAEGMNAELYVKATDQDGIYDKDPKKFPSVTKLDRIGWDELSRILTQAEHRAGMHQVLDPEAVRLLRNRKVKVVVVNGLKSENVLRAVKGEAVGTIVD